MVTAVTPLDAVRQVPDPEVPILTIEDLGILRDVSLGDDGRVEVVITPTYSGCPAVEQIRDDIVIALSEHGYGDVTVRTVLAPAWTTDWMSDEGRRKLVEYGIAPPDRRDPGGTVLLTLASPAGRIRCPQCGSPDTGEVSRFGSTACKALYSCRSCLEPFDYFKVL
jgi:ring-1,2-phenylacetyl-CoA epoxidase subunit PaaD